MRQQSACPPTSVRSERATRNAATDERGLSFKVSFVQKHPRMVQMGLDHAPSREEEKMKKSRARLILPILTFGAFAAWEAAHLASVLADEKQQPKTSVTVTDLEKRKGPKPPSGATSIGIEAQPMVGDLTLPIQNVPVYQFSVKTQQGATIPVKWAYQPGTGTFMWATAPIDCGDGNTIARGGFVMKIREDGTGSYALGTRQCPVATIYGCGFDAHQNKTGCGACAWNGNDLACAQN
jgi:hypothetical protein